MLCFKGSSCTVHFFGSVTVQQLFTLLPIVCRWQHPQGCSSLFPSQKSPTPTVLTY